GFPTDMQPQITTLLTTAGGISMVTEGIFSGGRFKYVDELRNMGAKITVEGSLAVVEGVPMLKGAPVRALDLRAGVAMVLAGLMADGVTQVENIKFIERGYENIVDKLAGLGADIHLQRTPDSYGSNYRLG
ncbi:MAG: UDP-N-acetylglucosamine 1-carboxyvinyltransferase, partial [Acutalibacter sp.]|nr:UDP-N-acetylglucosamine 1-carboxyvinyltransferase [Acutalibacter sp.]